MFLINILIFLVVLGLLVFFHEMGHFLAAKACNIYVDRFSLGMPPRVWGFKYGETDYCVGALPIGGYVKMAGQEDAPRSEEAQEHDYAHVPPDRWFSNKPVWQRLIVLAAGPFMNVVLAVLLYAVYAGVGFEVPEAKVDNRIGLVQPDSPAASAPLYPLGADGTADLDGEPPLRGWQPGDRIVSIDGEPVRNITDVAIAGALSGGEPVQMLIERADPGGEPVRYLSLVSPKVFEGERHPRFGVGPYMTAQVAKVEDDSPAAAAGVEVGDIIVGIDGEPVDWNTMKARIEETAGQHDLQFLIDRGGTLIERSIRPETVGGVEGISFLPQHPGAEEDEAAMGFPVVYDISDEAAEETGLQRKDIVTAVNGDPVTFGAIHDVIQDHPNEEITLTVERPAIGWGLLQRSDTFETTLAVGEVGLLGIAPEPRTALYRVPPYQVIPEAMYLTKQAVSRTVQTVAMLVTGGVSAKDLGGPVMIYQATTQAANAGLLWLLEITAFISVNLCIFNLLPLPVLDGGQIVLLGVEGVRGKPLDIRILERIQQFGVLFIIFLILFVTYNDITRVVTDMLP